MALNDLAEVAPEWLRDVAPDEWYERYGHRVEAYRLPKRQEERAKLAVEIGKDGFYLLEVLKKPTSPDALCHQQERRHSGAGVGGAVRAARGAGQVALGKVASGAG